MNPGKYLESRFVQCQGKLRQKKINTPMEAAENEAVIAWLWLVTKIVILFKIFMIFGHYLGVLVRIFPKPRAARELADELVSAEMQDKKMLMEAMKGVAKDGQENFHKHQVVNVKG